MPNPGSHGSGLGPSPGCGVHIQALPQVTLVPLDLTNERSVTELAGEIGGKVDIVVNTAEVHRTFGIGARRGTDVARAEMEINYFGLLRLAQAFGPALKGRSADGALQRHRLGQPAVGLRAGQLSAARHLQRQQGGGAFAGAMPARRDAAGRHPRHQPLSRADRRRMEPEPAAAQAHARSRWPTPS
jgi:NAD(P)-dependent dehydrogenase (short-subunit alcohol dehydrogenase family)